MAFDLSAFDLDDRAALLVLVTQAAGIGAQGHGSMRPAVQSVEVGVPDHRIRCNTCGRWMRFTPTEKTPARRRPSPHAGHCTDCAVEHTVTCVGRCANAPIGHDQRRRCARSIILLTAKDDKGNTRCIVCKRTLRTYDGPDPIPDAGVGKESER